jgi:RHS repeat-associated protein
MGITTGPDEPRPASPPTWHGNPQKSPAHPERQCQLCCGNQTGHTGTATTPLGYDGQYTNTDTGLIYLRAREYDPATAQFSSVDPAVESTLEAYTYTHDNPVNQTDPTGKEVSPEARQFTHEYFGELSRLRRKAKKLHISLGKFGIYEDYALTGYYAIRFNMDYDNTADYHSWNSYYNITLHEVVRALAPLALSLDTAETPSDLIKTLVMIAASVFGL